VPLPPPRPESVRPLFPSTFSARMLEPISSLIDKERQSDVGPKSVVKPLVRTKKPFCPSERPPIEPRHDFFFGRLRIGWTAVLGNYDRTQMEKALFFGASLPSPPFRAIPSCSLGIVYCLILFLAYRSSEWLEATPSPLPGGFLLNFFPIFPTAFPHAFRQLRKEGKTSPSFNLSKNITMTFLCVPSPPGDLPPFSCP